MSKASRKFHVPDALANLYEFANSLDLRHFVHHGVQHAQADELESAVALGKWMFHHGLTKPDTSPSSATFGAALGLRDKIRDYLECAPEERKRNVAVGDALNKAMERFPLRVAAVGKQGLELTPVGTDAAAGLSAIVAELYNGSANGSLDRLKMCASNECKRVFFDRSKPGTRRWCQSTLCGNRQKTRSYRERLKREGSG
jgi:predicted RNA-binding Zn ribbon-like protein